MLIQNEIQRDPTTTMGCITVAYVSVRILVSVCAFLTYILKTKGPIFQGVGVSRRIWVNTMWNVRCSASRTAWRKSRNARRGVGRRGARGSRFPRLEGSPSRMRRGSRDAKRGAERECGVGRKGARRGVQRERGAGRQEESVPHRKGCLLEDW
jgi:hypothetical protein